MPLPINGGGTKTSSFGAWKGVSQATTRRNGQMWRMEKEDSGAESRNRQEAREVE
jgi:hypothetical protein